MFVSRFCVNVCDMILTFKIETLTSKKAMDVKEWLRELKGWMDGIQLLNGENIKIL